MDSTLSKGEQAKQLFLAGHNCAQAVFLAFSKDLGLDDKTALRVSACFGGGIGRLREVCGAVSAMFMALGLKYASETPSDHEAKARLYARVQELAKRFKDENGSIICRELLALPAGPQDPSPEPHTPDYYKARPCPEKVRCAANILEEYFRQNP